MKCWQISALTGLSALRLAEAPDPVPAEGEVVLAVEFAALNPADRYLAENQYPAKPTFPHVLGRDGVGVVTAVGAGVSEFNPGDRVLILRSDVGVNRAGTFAQKVLVPAESLAVVPAGWTPQQAAAAPLVYLTAYQALTQWDEIPAGVGLITGASGGVGVASVQLAVAMGYTVVALSRSAKKQEQLKQLGAKITLDPTDGQWPAKLKTELAGRRVDLAIDSIGGALFNAVLSTLGMNGKISVIGRLAGPVPEFNTASLFFRRIRIGGVAVGDYTAEQSQAAWKQIVLIMEKGGARPVVDSVHSFENLPAAFNRLDEGPMGKVLIASPSGQ